MRKVNLERISIREWMVAERLLHSLKIKNLCSCLLSFMRRHNFYNEKVQFLKLVIAKKKKIIKIL